MSEKRHRKFFLHLDEYNSNYYLAIEKILALKNVDYAYIHRENLCNYDSKGKLIGEIDEIRILLSFKNTRTETSVKKLFSPSHLYMVKPQEKALLLLLKNEVGYFDSEPYQIICSGDNPKFFEDVYFSKDIKYKKAIYKKYGLITSQEKLYNEK